MFESKHKLRLKIIDLNLVIEVLKIDLKWAERREEEAKKKLEEYRAKSTEKTRDASIYVDWDNLKVVSIERRVNEWGVTYTEVGHLLEHAENGQVVERYKSLMFYCSDELHDGLIDDYEEWKTRKEYE